MVDVLTILLQTATLCLMMFPGIAINKLKLGSGQFTKGLSNYLLFIAEPCMLIFPYIRDFDPAILRNMGITLLMTFVCHGIYTLVAFTVFRGRHDLKSRVYKIAVIFGNCGYMGIPLIRGLLGEEATIYATVFVVGFQVFEWTFGCYIATEDRKQISFKRVITRPTLLFIMAGILIFLLPINRYIPSILVDCIRMLKETIVPMSMLIVGYRLAESPLKSFFTDGKMWISVGLRLIGSPLIVFCLLKLLSFTGVFGGDLTVPTAVLVCSATPCATATAVFAEKYDLDHEVAGRLVPLSTILCVGTIPLMALLLRFI